jgi:DNA-binding LytR/AlgR family response regulator
MIVEDEPLAAGIIRDYISEVSFLELAADCRDAMQAMEILSSGSVDVLFLDIHLPKLKGLELLRALTIQPQVIITTAFPDYALSGYEYNIRDYLLKPVSFERFLKAVNKLDRAAQAQELMAERHRPFHFFNTGKKMVKVWLDEIQYIESLKEYCTIHTPSATITTKAQLGELAELLGAHSFFRIHRSYIVAMDKIVSYDATEITVGVVKLPIGRTFKKEVMEALQRPAKA